MIYYSVASVRALAAMLTVNYQSLIFSVRCKTASCSGRGGLWIHIYDIFRWWLNSCLL